MPERKLSILIATVGWRRASFTKLLERLFPQIERNNIEVVAYWNNGETDIGSIRQALLEDAKGEYVCFIDDDDMVPDWYCDEIFWNLGRDYVGFQVELFNDGVKMPPVYHSIRYGVWHDDETGYYRGVTHLNPIKRELALLGNFGKQGLGEDETWSRSVTPHVRTEHYIDKIMYYYYHNKAETTFGGKERKPQFHIRSEFDHPQFRYHPLSKKEGKT